MFVELIVAVPDAIAVPSWYKMKVPSPINLEAFIWTGIPTSAVTFEGILYHNREDFLNYQRND